MARKRYSDEGVLNLLRQIEPSLASGNSVETACRSAGIRSHQALNMRLPGEKIKADCVLSARG